MAELAFELALLALCFGTCSFELAVLWLEAAVGLLLVLRESVARVEETTSLNSFDHSDEEQ